MTAKNSARKQLLKEQAYRRLKQMVLDGTYPPGTFLSERKLATQLGMSKTPVRAALERVELEGFIAVAPHQGIVVRELSLREIKEHYDIRMALETFVVSRLAGKLTPEQVLQVEENLAAQISCIKNGDILGHVAHDRDFHLLLANFLDNREIIRVMEHQRDKVYRVTSQISLRHPARMQQSYEEHVGIFEAIHQGDGDLAAARMQAHLEAGKQFILSA